MINDTLIESLINTRKKTMKKIPSGNINLDIALEGGYEVGKLTEIAGDSGSGKTFLAVKAIKECQRREKIALYIDTNRILNNKIIENNNIDPDLLLIINSNEADTIGPIISKLDKDIIGLIVVDDVASLTVKKEKDNSIGRDINKLRYKIVKSLLTRLANVSRDSDIVCLIVNQLRNNFVDNIRQLEMVSSFEKVVEMCCDTRISLRLNEKNETRIKVKRKERRLK